MPIIFGNIVICNISMTYDKLPNPTYNDPGKKHYEIGTSWRTGVNEFEYSQDFYIQGFCELRLFFEEIIPFINYCIKNHSLDLNMILAVIVIASRKENGLASLVGKEIQQNGIWGKRKSLPSLNISNFDSFTWESEHVYQYRAGRDDLDYDYEYVTFTSTDKAYQRFIKAALKKINWSGFETRKYGDVSEYYSKGGFNPHDFLRKHNIETNPFEGLSRDRIVKSFTTIFKVMIDETIEVYNEFNKKK